MGFHCLVVQDYNVFFTIARDPAGIKAARNAVARPPLLQKGLSLMFIPSVDLGPRQFVRTIHSTETSIYNRKSSKKIEFGPCDGLRGNGQIFIIRAINIEIFFTNLCR